MLNQIFFAGPSPFQDLSKQLFVLNQADTICPTTVLRAANYCLAVLPAGHIDNMQLQVSP